MSRVARALSRFAFAAALGTATARALAAPPPGGDVLTMTPENLDRLSKGLAAEEAARRALAAKAPKTKSPAEYDQCRSGVLSGPDAMKLMEDFSAASQKAASDTAALVKAAEAMQKGMDALVEKRCGSDPAVGRSSAQERQREIAEAAAKDAGLTARQYAILKERVTPFCALGGAAGKEGARIKAPGGAYWVYSASEVSALSPRCAALTKALRVETP